MPKKTLIFMAAMILAVTSMTASAGGDIRRGQAKAGEVCASCHGADGRSPVPTQPHLAGQYEDYLLQAIQAYKSGERQNPIMQGMVASLSKQDMKDLAAYYASLKPVLKKHP